MWTMIFYIMFENLLNWLDEKKENELDVVKHHTLLTCNNIIPSNYTEWNVAVMKVIASFHK